MLNKKVIICISPISKETDTVVMCQKKMDDNGVFEQRLGEMESSFVNTATYDVLSVKNYILSANSVKTDYNVDNSNSSKASTGTNFTYSILKY